MREEIEAGLKNAVERGDSLDDAINSFINAGYNPVEVKEAAKNISASATDMVSEKPEAEKASSTSMFTQTNKPFQQQKAPIDNMAQIQSKFDSMPVKQIETKKENPQISPKQDLTKVAPKKIGSKSIVIGSLIGLIILLIIFLTLVIIYKDSLIAWIASS